LVVLATLATIIASQAIITASFSMTRQAVQLGWFPGVQISQTSAKEHGRIYVPFMNWTMMAFTVALTVGFGSSDHLAGAYGTAASTTMVLTTALLYYVMRNRWHWSLYRAAAVTGILLEVDLAFFSANLLSSLWFRRDPNLPAVLKLAKKGRSAGTGRRELLHRARRRHQPQASKSPVAVARRIIFLHVAQFSACRRPVQHTLERTD
jgi:hypothetical protein